MNNIIRDYSINIAYISNIPYYQNTSILSDNDSDSSDGRPRVTLDNKLFFNNIYKDSKTYNNNEYSNIIEKEDFKEQNYNSSFITTNENKMLPDIPKVNLKANNNNNYCKGKNELIFKIIKINKKIGRIKKNSLIKGKHNRFSEDNIIRKIKTRFHEKLRLYINFEYKKYILKKNPKKKKVKGWLKRINPKISRKIKKEENLKWFESKISDIFSENVSLRYSPHLINSNKKKIEFLLSVNEAIPIIDILNTKVETIFEKYINNEELEGFKTLDDDIDEMRAQMKKSIQDNLEQYLNKYEYVAKNMKKIFMLKSARNYIHKNVET